MRWSVLMDSLEERSAEAVAQSQQAADALQRAAQDAASTAKRITAQALEEFRRAASGAVENGLRYPLEDASRKLEDGVGRIESAMQTLDAHIKVQSRMLAAYAWKTFVASALAALVMIGVAVYMGLYARQEITRAEWVGEINAAVANGKLVACPGGGLCVYRGKKLERLDQ
ncbi:MAG: hypothetical protein FWG56_03210 [Desulfovibrionaceae bacterium]|nr:hypothetical protein [Desulfovibrionaceae bacterium]